MSLEVEKTDPNIIIYGFVQNIILLHPVVFSILTTLRLFSWEKCQNFATLSAFH